MKMNFLRPLFIGALLLLAVLVLFSLAACKRVAVDDILNSDLPEEWQEAKADYQASWDSIDSREIPEWFKDAKFGIFIHWGLYSVPAWAPVGVYSEWYQYWMTEASWLIKDHRSSVQDYHYKTYGENFEYDKFAQEFKAENFDADEWATLFNNAGAKYMVLTSKHHEGFCLWPSPTANKTWDKPWNSVDTGAGRDLVGELEQAVRKTDLKFGLYYSLYEWYNPLWAKKLSRKQFVDEHYIPQLKELVTGYSPDILWADGEWEMRADKWRSTYVLSWILNHTPNQKDFVLNDRWGKDIRNNHAGYYTAEYGAGFENDAHPWEEARGMGFSFGYNQNEEDGDYRTVDELLITLIDVVSRGGNLLLNIGPEGDGSIPEVMQKRLTGMGEWLAGNGEAIYGTRSWDRSCQWSEGTRPDIKGGDGSHDYDIVKFTVEPDDGMAVKEIFFTCSKNEEGEVENLFLILPKKTAGGMLTVKNMAKWNFEKAVSVKGGQELEMKWHGSDLVIDVRSIEDSISSIRLVLGH